MLTLDEQKKKHDELIKKHSRHEFVRSWLNGDVSSEQLESILRIHRSKIFER